MRTRTRMNVRPAREGLIVPDPERRSPLPAGGASVPRSSYWLRRLRYGEVVEVKPSPPAAARSSSKQPTTKD